MKKYIMPVIALIIGLSILAYGLYLTYYPPANVGDLFSSLFYGPVVTIPIGSAVTISSIIILTLRYRKSTTHTHK